MTFPCRRIDTSNIEIFQYSFCHALFKKKQKKTLNSKMGYVRKGVINFILKKIWTLNLQMNIHSVRV